LAVVAAVALLAAGPRAAPPDPPALVVLVVVDQMRADYVDRFRGDWTGGLKRLVSEGAWFQRAAYPYLSTVTCAGHATIATGAFPHAHGVFQNAWWDRGTHAQMSCTADPHASSLGYGTTVAGGDSGYRLQVPTFADQMRARRHARVVTLSLKDRSAIMLAGHGGDAVTWLSNSLDGWQTSSAFNTGPVPAVKAFTEANPIAADYGKIWGRILPPASYTGADDGLGEAPAAGWTRAFPHALTGTAGKADGTFVAQWQSSPFADAYLGRFAAALVDSMQLGAHEGTDVLGVSFSSPDLVGHAFGPRSHEVQDIYAHLDATLGALFNHLDSSVGKDRWVVALSADHGVTPIPEQLTAEGADAGRIDATAIADAIEQVVRPALGAGKHVAAINSNDIYFEPGVYEAIRKSPRLIDAVIAAVSARPGIRQVFPGERVRRADKSSDALIRAASLSYVSGRSGDLILAAKPGWMFSTTGTTHGSATDDDQRVPLLLMGHGIKPGTYLQRVTPADIAPTLATLAGTSLPRAEGHPLPCLK
jgi:predicted AlkP superfamily pyrophosphatase or phosphodiesterase